MKNDLQTRIDAIREEFQDARPDVVMLIDELVKNIQDVEYRLKCQIEVCEGHKYAIHRLLQQGKKK